MKNRRALTLMICVVLAVSFAFTSQAFGKKGGSGKGNGSYKKSSDGTPPGWSKGKKTGWGGGKYPPGWSNWSEDRRKKWSADRDTAQVDIGEVCARYRFQDRTRNEIAEAFDQAIAGGKAIDASRKKLISAIENEKNRKRIIADTMEAVADILR